MQRSMHSLEQLAAIVLRELGGHEEHEGTRLAIEHDPRGRSALRGIVMPQARDITVGILCPRRLVADPVRGPRRARRAPERPA